MSAQSVGSRARPSISHRADNSDGQDCRHNADERDKRETLPFRLNINRDIHGLADDDPIRCRERRAERGLTVSHGHHRDGDLGAGTGGNGDGLAWVRDVDDSLNRVDSGDNRDVGRGRVGHRERKFGGISENREVRSDGERDEFAVRFRGTDVGTYRG